MYEHLKLFLLNFEIRLRIYIRSKIFLRRPDLRMELLQVLDFLSFFLYQFQKFCFLILCYYKYFLKILKQLAMLSIPCHEMRMPIKQSFQSSLKIKTLYFFCNDFYRLRRDSKNCILRANFLSIYFFQIQS